MPVAWIGRVKEEVQRCGQALGMFWTWKQQDLRVRKRGETPGLWAWAIGRMELPFLRWRRLGVGRAVVVFGKGRIRRLILDSLHLRRLLGLSTVDVKRPLEMYESGVQESGLRRWFKARRWNEITEGLSLDRKEKRTGDHTLWGLRRIKDVEASCYHRELGCGHQRSVHHPLSVTSLFLFGGNLKKTKACSEKHKEENNTFPFSHPPESATLNISACWLPLLLCDHLYIMWLCMSLSINTALCF